MAPIYYPAVLHKEENGYSACVPDLPGCFTQGETIQETMAMLQEAIGLYLDDVPEYPKATAPELIDVPQGDFLVMAEFDSLAYQQKYNNKAVKKTLTIPTWLNDLARSANLDFSKTLQDALKMKLGIG